MPVKQREKALDQNSDLLTSKTQSKCDGTYGTFERKLKVHTHKSETRTQGPTKC